MNENSIKIFEQNEVRTVWDEDKEKWFISIIDVIFVLAQSKDYLTARKYWNKLKQRLKAEGNETVTNCHQLKMKAQEALELKTGKKVVTNLNAKSALQERKKLEVKDDE